MEMQSCLRLAPLFTDGAVFQCGMPVPVWGTAAPGSMVNVSFAGDDFVTRCSSDGSFMLYIPEYPAGGPYVLTAASGDEKVEINDVLVGEVWLAGGQSNMSFELNCTPEWIRRGYDQVMAQKDEFISTIKDQENFRMLTVPRKADGTRQSYFQAEWKKLTPENAGEFSAVASWFGRTLQEKLGVPVGIISCNWGGSNIETWTSISGLRRNPDTAPMLDFINRRKSAAEFWESDYQTISQMFNERFAARDPGNKGEALGYADASFDDSSWAKMKIPGSWIGQNICGNGAVWVRMAVELPEDWKSCELLLHTGGIDKSDITYFNGKEIGRSGGGFDASFYDKPRCYTVPADAVKAGRNLIAVRAFSYLFNGALGGFPEDFYLERKSDGSKIYFAGYHPAKAEYDAGVIQPNPVIDFWVPENPQTPSLLFDSMVNPLIPYAMRGVIWYQGESNARNCVEAKQYCGKLRTLIEDWRYRWAQGDFPFIQVELASFRAPSSFDAGSAWAMLRESQNKVCSQLPSVGIVSALDLGDEINIHPVNKKDVGLRLADHVLADYGRDAGKLCRGPRFRSMDICGNKLRLEFDFAAGLHFKGGSPRGFYLENISGKTVPADEVVIENGSIILSSKAVPLPTGVWYSWSDNPDGNLCNQADLPAMPFRAGSALER